MKLYNNFLYILMGAVCFTYMAYASSGNFPLEQDASKSNVAFHIDPKGTLHICMATEGKKGKFLALSDADGKRLNSYHVTETLFSGTPKQVHESIWTDIGKIRKKEKPVQNNRHFLYFKGAARLFYDEGENAKDPGKKKDMYFLSVLFSSSYTFVHKQVDGELSYDYTPFMLASLKRLDSLGSNELAEGVMLLFQKMLGFQAMGPPNEDDFSLVLKALPHDGEGFDLIYDTLTYLFMVNTVNYSGEKKAEFARRYLFPLIQNVDQGKKLVEPLNYVTRFLYPKYLTKDDFEWLSFQRFKELAELILADHRTVLQDLQSLGIFAKDLFSEEKDRVALLAFSRASEFPSCNLPARAHILAIKARKYSSGVILSEDERCKISCELKNLENAVADNVLDPSPLFTLEEFATSVSSIIRAFSVKHTCHEKQQDPIYPEEFN